MPYRKHPLITGEIYHIFNRSIAHQSIFLISHDYHRMLDLIDYYRYTNLPLRYSYFKRLNYDMKKQYTKQYLGDNRPQLKILTFCIMPNHYHFLIKQLSNKAISNFVRNIQNSYAKYFNIRHKRSGSLFQAMFKAKRIETDEQLLHVSRYIHLNPASEFVTELAKLEKYPWSSFKDYMGNMDGLVDTEYILSHFKSKDMYKKFVYDQADYHLKLKHIKHLILEQS